MGGMELNDKGLKLLEQYDLQVQGTRRGRGSYICETDKGLKLFTDFAGSSNRLAFVNRVLYHLREEGFTKVDVVMPAESAIQKMKGRSWRPCAIWPGSIR